MTSKTKPENKEEIEVKLEDENNEAQDVKMHVHTYLWLKLVEVLKKAAEDKKETTPGDVLQAMAVLESRVFGFDLDEHVKKRLEEIQEEDKED
jgi:hypothetical protein